VAEKPHDLDSDMIPDVWVLPKYVITVSADEMTQSQSHTACRDLEGVGLSLRFPRVIGFIRGDKGATDATTTVEIASLFSRQKRIQME
jgi:DNA ligase-1